LAGYIARWYTRLKTDIHTSTNRAQHRVTSFIQRTIPPLRQTTKQMWSASYVTLTYIRNLNTHISMHAVTGSALDNLQPLTSGSIHAEPLPYSIQGGPAKVKPTLLVTFEGVGKIQ